MKNPIIENNAITAFMGGPRYLKITHYADLFDVEFELIDVNDLRFHLDWNWLIPVWSKIRFEMTPGIVIAAITHIDNNDIDKLHSLIAIVAMDWCKAEGIKLN